MGSTASTSYRRCMHDAAVAPEAVRRVTGRLPPHAYFVVSAVFHYLGPAFAVLLFARLDPLGVAWLRIGVAAAVFAAWRRPWRVWRFLNPVSRRLVVGWGCILAVMNACFYLAIDRLALGTVAAIEFVPVIVLAAVASRTGRNVAALLLAVAGVYLFTAYIVLGHRVARCPEMSGIDGLALAMIVAAVAALPLGFGEATPAFTDPMLLAAAVGVGISSSVIPYVCDQLAMTRLSRGTYALLVSLLPATATVIGIVVLRQVPAPLEVVGVLSIEAAVAVHRELGIR